ncbi:MAG: hypothetical protein ACP5C3_07620 [Methanomicrobiales archaeon]
MSQQDTEINNLEDFRKGYKCGFSDGYKQAMEEIFKLQKLRMEKSQEEIYTPGVQPRSRFWPFW